MSNSVSSALQVLLCLLRYPFVEMDNIRQAIFDLIRALLKRFIAWVMRKNRLLFLNQQLLNVQSYAEWDQITKEMDAINGKQFWKVSDLGGAYDPANATMVKRLTGMRSEHYDAKKVFH